MDEAPLLEGAEPQGSIWMQRDILLLALCWAITLTTSTLLTTIGPLAAQSLGASDALAPFSIGIFLLGAAASSYPSGMLFRKVGRFLGFSVGCLFQVMGSVFGCIGMQCDSLFSMMVGCFFVGLGQGLGQFYRFSAVEVSPDHLKSEAVTLVLTGGVLAAFAGPTSANYSKDAFGEDYLGSFFIMGILGTMNVIVVSMVNFKDTYAFEKEDDPTRSSNASSAVSGISTGKADARRPVLEVMQQPLFVLSCAIATVAHTVMVMLMSNCSLAMESRGYSFQNQTFVMEFHFCAMFMPGFYTGRLIKAYGSFKASLLGAVIFTMSAAAFASGEDDLNFYVGMILLGLAWNLSFSAGTVMLTDCYRPSEAPDIQAVNDLILFTVAGAGSIISGVVYGEWGWSALVYVVSVMMVFNLVLLLAATKVRSSNDERERSQSVSERIKMYSSDQETFDAEAQRLSYMEKVRTVSVG